MDKRATVVAAALALLIAAGSYAQEDQPESGLAAAIAGGEPGVFFRYRYEYVDEADFDENAHASTLLMRLNYETDSWRNWSGFIEFDHVMEVLVNDYNSAAGTSSPRRDQYPVVADPKGPDLNQLYFQWEPNDNWKNRVGRQRINLDDQRFVGGVFWRQNEQTYDSLSINHTGFAKTNIFYSYVTTVRRVFGSTVPAGRQKHNTHLLNASFEQVENWKFVGYAYLIDDEDFAPFSTSTFGARATGSISAGDHKIDLLGELATQSDYANNPASFTAAYYRLQGIWSLGKFSAGIGIESLGSDNDQGFRTPLATLHAFNGWADQFLATPAAGLDDVYLRGGYKPGKWNLQLIYHDFSAETGGADFGTELDLLATRPLGDGYSLLLKFADFRSDNAGFVDTTKAWVMVTLDFQ
jgi:hypothetical protein